MCHYVQPLFLRTIWSFVTWGNNLKACFSIGVLRSDGRASWPFCPPAFTRFLFAITSPPVLFCLIWIISFLANSFQWYLPVTAEPLSSEAPNYPTAFQLVKSRNTGKVEAAFSSTRSKFSLSKLWLRRRRLSVFWKKCKQVLSRAECTVDDDSPSVSISQDSQSQYMCNTLRYSM